jgi:orotidine-5'-phosphate decarboxylase
VVGRPITRASDPAQAAQAILKEIGGAILPSARITA